MELQSDFFVKLPQKIICCGSVSPVVTVMTHVDVLVPILRVHTIIVSPWRSNLHQFICLHHVGWSERIRSVHSVGPTTATIVNVLTVSAVFVLSDTFPGWELPIFILGSIFVCSPTLFAPLQSEISIFLLLSYRPALLEIFVSEVFFHVSFAIILEASHPTLILGFWLPHNNFYT